MRLIELEEQKTRFLHQVSHELKTPLSAIREGAELMADGSVGPLSQPQVEVARILRENTLRLQRLIEDLLNYHTVQFQRSGLHLRRVELAPVIHRVAEAHQLPVRAKEIRLKINCPPIALEADENKLEVILDNLLSNAVKFSPPFGEILVTARVRGHEVIVDVMDEGPGIAPAERDRIFDPFYQGKARPHETGQGHGTGSGDRARIRCRARRQGPDRGRDGLRRAFPAAAPGCAHRPGTLMPSRRLSALPSSGASGIQHCLSLGSCRSNTIRSGTLASQAPRCASSSCWRGAYSLRPASRRPRLPRRHPRRWKPRPRLPRPVPAPPRVSDAERLLTYYTFALNLPPEQLALEQERTLRFYSQHRSDFAHDATGAAALLARRRSQGPHAGAGNVIFVPEGEPGRLPRTARPRADAADPADRATSSWRPRFRPKRRSSRTKRAATTSSSRSSTHWSRPSERCSNAVNPRGNHEYSNEPDVMLVDDDPDLLRLLSIRLQGAGYGVTAVESGEAALSQVVGRQPRRW